MSTPRRFSPLFPLLLALPLFAGTACGPTLEEDPTFLVSGSPEAIAVIDFVNHESTTYELLDERLDKRAAAGLINGRPFATIEAIDDVSYVGATAMARLLEMATEGGFLRGDDDILGSFDGVEFTVAEAKAALRIVNEESEGVLDGEVGLPSRAITSILAARPVASMEELAGLYWVGTRGLENLRAYVRNFISTPGERADCRGDFQCDAGFRCGGIPRDGSGDLGKCYPTTQEPGEWSDCTSDESCPGDLFCSGLTMGWNSGFCSAQWMQDTFTNSTQRFIPQDGSIVGTGVVVYGQASVPMDIVVDIELAHDRPEDLRIVLLDPNGSDATLWDGPNEGGREMPSSFVALGNISRDDEVNGRWLLQITNVGGRGLGNVHGWDLWISSRFD